MADHAMTLVYIATGVKQFKVGTAKSWIGRGCQFFFIGFRHAASPKEKSKQKATHPGHCPPRAGWSHGLPFGQDAALPFPNRPPIYNGGLRKMVRNLRFGFFFIPLWL